jgi:hypothetical protein
MDMFYIYSKKGWHRAPTKSGKWWGAFPYAMCWPTLEEAEKYMQTNRFLTELQQASIMRVEHV